MPTFLLMDDSANELGGGGGGGTYIMHGGSLKSTNPQIRLMTGWSTSGKTPTRQTLLARSAKRRVVFGESHKGEADFDYYPGYIWYIQHSVSSVIVLFFVSTRKRASISCDQIFST